MIGLRKKLRCSIKKGVLKILQNSQKNTYATVSFINLHRLWHRYFPMNFVRFQKIPFLQSTSGQLLLWLNTVSIQKQNSPYSVNVCTVLILVNYWFTKRSSVTFVYIIFCFVVFNSREILILFLILLVFISCFTNTCIPKVIDPCNLPLHQVVLSFCHPVAVFCFILGSRMGLL